MTLVCLPDEDYIRALEPLPPGIEAIAWGLDGPAPARTDEIEYFVLRSGDSRDPGKGLLQLSGLRCVQILTTGFDDVLDLIPPWASLATAAGTHDASTAEFAVGLILASLRGIPAFVQAQAEQRWARELRPSLADRTALIVGYGGVGRSLGRRLLAFEVQATAVARTARVDAEIPVYGMDDMLTLLPEQEIVILCVPLTSETVGLVDDRFLTSMREGALLVNVSRGRVVQTDVLVEHLAARRIAAALDVVDPEPLPHGHPLWSAPNLLLTPHVGGNSTAFRPRIEALLKEQLRRLARGDALMNVVRPAEQT